MILVDISVRSTEDLNSSCEKFPFWLKVRLVFSHNGHCVVFHFLASMFTSLRNDSNSHWSLFLLNIIMTAAQQIAGF